MNFIQHYKSWRTLVETDDRMTAQHITLYLTLFDYWNLARFRNPIMIFRDEAMYLSRIGSINTYRRCIRELSEWGYINYMPSKNPQKGSRVEMYEFDVYADLVADAEDWRQYHADNIPTSDALGDEFFNLYPDPSGDDSPDLSPGLSGGASRDLSPGLSGGASRDLSPGASGGASHDLSPGASGNASHDPSPGASGNASHDLSAGASGDASHDLSPGASGGASREPYKTNITNNTNNSNSINSLNALNHGPSDSTSKTSDRVNNNTNPHDETTYSGGDHRQSEKNKTSGGRRAGGDSASAKCERGTAKTPSTLEEATAYFVEIGSDALEAQTFYSHYKALGWKVNGAPVEHWQALADKWLIKSRAIAASKPKEKHPAGRLHVENNKNYAEPL